MLLLSTTLFGLNVTNMNYNEYLNKGDEYSKNKQYKKAINSYKEAIKLNSQGTYPYFQLYDIYLTLRKYEKSIDILNKNINNSTEKLFKCNVYTMISDSYIKLDDLDNAKLFLNKCLLLNVNNFTTFQKLAQINILNLDFDKAIENIENAYDTDDGYFRKTIAINYYKKKRYEKAIEHFEKILKYNYNDDFTLYYLAVSNLKIKKYKIAIKYFKLTIKINSKKYKRYSYLELIDIYNELKKYDEVLKIASQMKQNTILTKIQSNGLFVLLGQTYAYKKNYKKGLEYFYKFLKIYPLKSYLYPWVFQLQLITNNHINKIDEQNFINIKNKNKSIIFEYKIIKHLEDILNNKKININILLEKYKNTKLDEDFFDWLKPWANKKEEPIKIRLLDTIKKIENFMGKDKNNEIN